MKFRSEITKQTFSEVFKNAQFAMVKPSLHLENLASVRATDKSKVTPSMHTSQPQDKKIVQLKIMKLETVELYEKR